MNELLEQSLLYDFYGELLTDKQKEIFESFVLDDLSLAEIAEDSGITRQGVHDMVKRSIKALKGYEDKLHLVDKFLLIKDDIKSLSELIEASNETKISKELSDEIEDILSRISREL
ncbi:MAG: YlxM family DNA-binding protein [Suipraeoptans sp.]